MIQTVNSAEIDTSGLARLFQEPENKSIERLAKLFKEEVKKASINYLKRNKVDYNQPLIHASEALCLVCELLSINIDKVKTPSRNAELVEARFIYCFLLMKVSNIKISLANVGTLINRDHATVIYSLNKCIDYNATSIPFRDKLDMCIAEYTRRFCNSECIHTNYNNIPQY